MSEEYVLEVLKSYWGYDQFRPLQRQAIECILAGRESLVVMPTGGGKSLCYQLPALCLPGMAIVVSPLIALMKDQVDAMRTAGIAAAAINSSMASQDRRSVFQQIESGKLKLLYMAPERLLAAQTLEYLARQHITFIAIDEAHCISSWGHDFRPEYRALRQLRAVFPKISIHAFTATATPQVRCDIVSQLGLENASTLVGDFLRPNLIYHTARRQSGLNQVSSVMDRFRGQSGIVYCISRAEVEKTSAWLNEMGYKTRPYHAGLSDDVRTANQNAFIADETDTIVATVAFGMGIDKSNVRYVIHAGMPKSIEHYQQESGRAGRDGLESECWLLYSPNDLRTWKMIIEQSLSEVNEAAHGGLERMYGYCTSVECRHRSLMAHFGQELTESCRACDVCLGLLEGVPNALIVGQKILSCVLRVHERFGAVHVSKVLAGSDEAKIIQFGHQRLSTWGILKEHRRTDVRDWIEQLVHQQFLDKQGEYQLLRVTTLGRELLRGKITPMLLKPYLKRTASTPTKIIDSWEGVDRGLFEHLRGLRRQCADDAALPAYIVFSDATLRDLARRRPSNVHRMLAVHGVGSKKAEDYGSVFVNAIVSYCQQFNTALDPEFDSTPSAILKQKPVNSSSVKSFEYFDAGLDVDEVAQKIDRARSTVMEYLQEYIQCRKITQANRWVALPDIERIEIAAEFAGIQKLKPIYEALHGLVDYDRIRIVLACRSNRLST